MPEFSNLLRQRLAVGKPADAHPDPDTLTAFAERLLSLREQNLVLEHLALCNECRDVIALSQSPLASHANLEVASLPASARMKMRTARRLWAPIFGLATSVAAMAVVAVLIVRGPHTGTPAAKDQATLVPAATPSASIVASSAPPALDTRPAENKLAATVASSEKPSRATRAEVNHDSVLRVTEHETAPAPPVVAAGNTSAVNAITASVGRRDYVNEKAIRGDAFTTLNQNGTMIADLPTAAGMRIDAPQLGYGFANNNKQLSSADLSVQTPGNTKAITVWTPATSAAGHGLPLIASAIKREGARIMSSTRRGTGLAISTPGTNAMSGQTFNPARSGGSSFEITSAGALGMSELGQTPAFTSPALRGRTAGRSETRPQTLWAVGDGKLLRTTDTGAWVSGYSGTDNIDFSAVTSQGAEVWAGGRNAALFHSRDGGVTWERVRLGESAAGAIKTISATGMNVQVTTSENQSWFSEDGGRTWTLSQ